MINISYIEYKKPLKDNMWFTAEPYYHNVDVELGSLNGLVRSDKRQISPYFYTDRKKSKASWNNSRQNVLILDIDDGMSIVDVKNILEGYEYLLYTTKSHQQEKQGKVCDRFRLIIPADNIPKAEDTYFVMLRLLRHKFKSDEQTENKSAGFLCNKHAKVHLNQGKKFDCTHYADKANTIAALEAKIVLLEREEKLERRNQYQSKSSNDLDPQAIKEAMDIEGMVEIIETLGYYVSPQKMFTLREERTPSVKIYANGVYDFGSGNSVDVFQLVMDRLNINFIEAMEYVNNYIRR